MTGSSVSTHYRDTNTHLLFDIKICRMGKLRLFHIKNNKAQSLLQFIEWEALQVQRFVNSSNENSSWDSWDLGMDISSPA